MKRSSEPLFDSITPSLLETAASRAFKGHGKKREVREFQKDFSANCAMLYAELMDGSYRKYIRYTPSEKENVNGKRRHIESPWLYLRIYQYVVLELLEPLYRTKDNGMGLNCKPGHGIASSRKRCSVTHRMKSLYYDMRHLHYVLLLDQRKCYDHVSPKAFRKAAKNLTKDTKLTDFAIEISFVGGKLPIGTPISPFIHHVVELAFEKWLEGISPFRVRYADDHLAAFPTKEEAQAAKWRIKNYWWYELGIRAKRHTSKVHPIDGLPLDYCGMVFRRNPGRGKSDHDKGYVTVRRSTVKRAMKSTSRNWPCYFGILRHADAYGLMQKIENDMKLTELTDKIRIIRKMDARNIPLKELEGVVFDIKDYDIRFRDKKPDWLKCLVSIRNNSTGQNEAREFHGSYQYLAGFIHKCELGFGGKEAILPIEGCEIENQCGYVFVGSNEYITHF